MARLITIQYTPHNETIEEATVKWMPTRGRKSISSLPQLVWGNGMPFTEANLWALNRAESHVSLKTVHSNLSKLLPYANFLEDQDLDVYHFPVRKAERNLVRYRGALIAARDERSISPSEASSRMRNAINFYRFIQNNGIMDPNLKLWKDRRFNISVFDRLGFERTVSVGSTDLSIPNRTRAGITLEDGLTPLSEDATRMLLTIADEVSPNEFRLMLLLGLQTGMRIGTICDLKIQTLERATPDPHHDGWMIINVGPNASPPVATKHSVSGQVRIPTTLVQKLLIYSASEGRLKRLGKSPRGAANRLFTTRNGAPFVGADTESGGAIRTFTYEIRKRARVRNCAELTNFHFHQTRCTFATRLTQALLAKHTTTQVIAFVKNALLHKNEATTWRYIRFVETAPLKRDAADAFTFAFLGAN